MPAILTPDSPRLPLSQLVKTGVSRKDRSLYLPSPHIPDNPAEIIMLMGLRAFRRQFRTLPVGTKDGRKCAGGCAAGAVVVSVQVPTLLRQLCLPRFDLVKMDIEGGSAAR